MATAVSLSNSRKHHSSLVSWAQESSVSSCQGPFAQADLLSSHFPGAMSPLWIWVIISSDPPNDASSSVREAGLYFSAPLKPGVACDPVAYDLLWPMKNEK